MRRTRREVCFLIDRHGFLLWSDTSSSPLALPDSRARWEAIWLHREVLAEIAHSHPLGPRAFSREDETTMEALSSALGRTLRFAVVAPDGMVRREGGRETRVGPEPWWASLLRLTSGMEPGASSRQTRERRASMAHPEEEPWGS